METLLYVVISVAASAFSSVVAFRIFSAHPEARIKAGALVIGGGAFWLIMSAVEVSTSNLATKLIFYRMHFVGVQIIPASWLILAMLVSGYEKWVKRKYIVALGIVPSIALLLAFTNEFHNLFWTNVTLNVVNPFLPLDVTQGLGFWVIDSGYSYAILLVGVIIFVRRIFVSRRLYRIQAIPMLLVASVPWMMNAVYHYNTSWFMYIDPTPLTLTIAGVILLWRLIYLPGIDVVPVAHEIIIDRLNEAIIILDAQGRIVELNPKAQDLVGHKLPDALGKPMEEIWIEWPRLRRELDSAVEKTEEVTFGVGDKKQIYELQSSPIQGLASNVPNLLITLRNITERKVMEDKLRIYSEHLEELVTERTKELREAERMAAIGEMAAMVGHDLRNPLQGISGATYVLKGSLHSTMDEQTKEMIEIIEQNVRHSNKIVSDLLAYSREPKLELNETNINQLVKEAVASAKIPQNIRVKLTMKDLRIRLDLEMMRRVFVNIITNAIDAMPNGGELAVEGHESNGSLKLSFTDTGMGFSDEAMAKLWKPLNTTKAQGSGLGLAICKRMVEAHNGTISVKTAPGRGTTLTITLPMQPSAGGENKAEATPLAS